MKNVMIGSPCYDGKVEAWHVSALVETCKIGLTKDINIFPIYMSYDAMIQRARNDIFKLAYEAKVDDLVFIDVDQDWNSNDFFKLLEHNVSVVGAPVCKKSDIEQYNVRLLGDFKVLENGLAEVDGIGTGFLRIRKDIIELMWEKEYKEYEEPNNRGKSKAIFEVLVEDNMLYSEDIVFCNKLANLGIKIYIDPTINCGHIGVKKWQGDFYNWIKIIKPTR